MSALGRTLVVSLFHGSLYFQLPPDAMQARLSLLYYAMMTILMSMEPFLPE